MNIHYKIIRNYIELYTAVLDYVNATYPHILDSNPTIEHYPNYQLAGDSVQVTRAIPDREAARKVDTGDPAGNPRAAERVGGLGDRAA